MTRQPCPHCGFMNFSISAYCGRCERPLPRPAEAQPSGATAPTHPAARPSGVPPAPQPTGAQPVMLSNSVQPVLLSTGAHPVALSTGVHQAPPPPARRQTGELIPTPPMTRPPLATVPAPLPPLTVEGTPVTAPPIELVAPKAHPGPNLGDEPADPQAEVAVEVPSLLRVLIGWIVDLALIVAVGAAVFFLEGLVTGVTFEAVSQGLLNALAEWLNTHRELALHGTLVAVIFAFAYSTRAALRSGQTVGRKLTNTVLVRKTGEPLGPTRLVLRFVLALPSALLLGAGYLWAIVDAYHRTWHDVLTGTVTVKRYVRVRR